MQKQPPPINGIVQKRAKCGEKIKLEKGNLTLPEPHLKR